MKRGPSSVNSRPTAASSRSRSNAMRRRLGPSCFASVINGSTTRRSSFAFGNVVRTVSCTNSDTAMLRYIAVRCGEFLPSLRPDFL